MVRLLRTVRYWANILSQIRGREIRLRRVTVMTSMAMVGLIYNRCLTIKDGVFDDSAAVTLMSNDTEQINLSANMFHELWSRALELCIGMFLLATELGWVCIVPLLIVICTLLQILIAL